MQPASQRPRAPVTMVALLLAMAACGGEIGIPDITPPRTMSTASGVTLDAYPRVVTVATGQLGTTTISWQRPNAVAYVTVSRDGGPETLFAASPAGQAQAPWIVGGSSYVFRLRAAAGGPLLASVNVTTAAPAPRTYASFAPYLQRYAGQLGNASGGLFSQWASLPRGTDRTDVYWGSPDNWDCAKGREGCPTAEEHGIRRGCSEHGPWVWIYAYRDDHVGARYRIQTTRAVLIRDGKTYDVTGQCGTEGQPYALAAALDKSYVLKVWGNILDNAGNLARRFYWQHRIQPPAPITNACWSGAGSRTRLALRQDELWWDSVLGWATGGGTMGANGEPTGTGTWYGNFQTMAENTGFGWTLGSRKSAGAAYSSACLYRQWSW